MSCPLAISLRHIAGDERRCKWVQFGCRLASIAKLAGDQLQPHIAALIPKLYRYQHDPNPRVREAMTHIWQAGQPSLSCRRLPSYLTGSFAQTMPIESLHEGHKVLWLLQSCTRLVFVV